MRWRLLLILLVSLGLTPGTWVRSAPKEPNFSQTLNVTELDLPEQDLGEVELTGVWHLTSQNDDFGSYSALLALDDGQFWAASDTGRLLRFPMPGHEGPMAIERFAGRTVLKKELIDIESLTREPDTGRIWIGYEGTNSIERMEGDLTDGKLVKPAGMRGWSSNSGPEAMVRLKNGHFIVISEGRESYWDSDYPALLFEGDPINAPGVRNFSFEPPEGYRPVDMAQMPDGRVLILVREFVLGAPPTFNVKLVAADPAEIEANTVWRGREVASISSPELEDNYEGLAILPREDGTLDLWLISDDNNTTFQRTLLLKLNWDPDRMTTVKEKARENPARPSKSSD